jgi:hypothetical protein
MFSVSLGQYEVRCQTGLPDFLGSYIEHAMLAEQIELQATEGTSCFLSLSRRGDPWPFLVVAQRYKPPHGFFPGTLIVPESNRLFLGAGERLLCYDLAKPARLWEDFTDCGFWIWSRWGDVVLMGAETELAAWSVDGQKLWTRFVDPPWTYRVAGNVIEVDCELCEPVSRRMNLLTGEPT